MAPDYLPRVSSLNCHYPFTFLGVLYHGCAENMENATSPCERWGCMQINYTAAVCAANIDYEAENKTITITIPTQGSTPVISIFDWIMFHHRVMASGFNWNLTWIDYKNGFGSLDSADYWMGLERVHHLTTSGSYRLRIEWQEAVTDYWFSIEYWIFYIEDEAAKYRLHVNGYVQGDDGRALVAGGGAVFDVLSYVHPFMTAAHDGTGFSTPYQDNDLFAVVNCAGTFGGGWWHTKCALFTVTTANPVWFSYADATFYQIKKARMMVKPQ